jgi:hypothetical protein
VSRIRNQIDNLLASDRALSLVVAIETALEDKRFEVQCSSRGATPISLQLQMHPGASAAHKQRI